MALFEEVGDRWGQAYCHQEFGDLARRRGDLVTARRHYEQALELRREVGERLLVGEAVNTLADFLLEHGEGGGADYAGDPMAWQRASQAAASRANSRASMAMGKAAMRTALERIATLGAVLEPPAMIRIEPA